MPITFYGYGRVSTDKQAVSPAAQCDMIQKEFAHQMATGALPPDSVWGGFIADTDVCRAIPFLHRPMGIHLAMNMKPGDRLCVSALDRLLGSPGDCESVIGWSKEKNIKLIIMDMRIDGSTSAGQVMLEVMTSFKGYERREIIRRTKEGLAYRRSQGLPAGKVPIGYMIKTIIPVGGRPMKYYFPCPKERRYGDAIVALKDEHGMSDSDIALLFNRRKIPNPRSTRLNTDRCTINNYYRAVKNGWPLHDGLQWKKPEFKYKFAAPNKTIDLTRASA